MDSDFTLDVAQCNTLEDLYSALAPMRMLAGWRRRPTSANPRQGFQPQLWQYAQAKSALDVAGALIDTTLAERRNLIMVNPTPGNAFATSRTIMAAYQMILPGERARTHRHTASALRLVLDVGPDVYTIVDGKKLPMLPGDVLLTPSWSWHGHANEGVGRAYWIDFLDVPLIDWLDARLFEDHPDTFGNSAFLAYDSTLRFAWPETLRRLEDASVQAGGLRNVEVELGNPALRNIALHMMKFVQGIEIDSKRSIANRIYAVIQGRGMLHIEGAEFGWRRGDVVIVPNRHEHRLIATEDAVLLRVSDAPLLGLN